MPKQHIGMSKTTKNAATQPRVTPRAVVLAGGRGTRLAPYTSVLPKPLMPIGDVSILELVVGQLSRAGFKKITLCVGYLSHLIRAVMDQGAQGIPLEREPWAQIAYVQEQVPLGTAGPLRLVDDLDDAFLVMNGDLLTTLDFAKFMRYHRRGGDALTIATHVREIEMDYGVAHLDDDKRHPRVRAYEEKPSLISNVSMGIYALEPRVLDFIPKKRHFDFPELIQLLLRKGETVGSYRYRGLWLDIGRPDDYAGALEAWNKYKHLIAPTPQSGGSDQSG